MTDRSQDRANTASRARDSEAAGTDELKNTASAQQGEQPDDSARGNERGGGDVAETTTGGAGPHLRVTLEPPSTERIRALNGPLNANIKHIEKRLSVQISNRGQQFDIVGAEPALHAAGRVLQQLYRETDNGQDVSPDLVHLVTGTAEMEFQPVHPDAPIKTPKLFIKPRGGNQHRYVQAIRTHDINFGVGPAGTGKTYLAVACAVQAFVSDQVQRILLVRPAVEAGEKLGFLPGDLAQKVDPYLRPLYDALYDMLGFEQVGRLLEKGLIEIAPLAFMRGRTLNHAFIILDESQNTSPEQMKMFLTRIGFGSTAVITGDVTQVDLPKSMPSGLQHALRVLDGVPGISTTRFLSKDVVRHPLVQRIVDAYEEFGDRA